MKKINRKLVLKFCRFSIVSVLLLICTSNVTNSVLLKWGFRDDQATIEYNRSYSLVGMMSGNAPRPFVYRSGLARTIKAFVDYIPPTAQDKLFNSIKRNDSLHEAYFSGVPIKFWTPSIAMTYYLMYMAVILCTFGSMLLVYRLARWHGLGFTSALGFLAAFSFVYPLTFQQGGYYYDLVELLGVLAACMAVLKGRLITATFLIALFSLNKETFFLVPLALFFLLDASLPLKRRLGWTIIQLSICMVTRHLIMHGFESNAGGEIEFHLLDNLKFWSNPLNYLGFYNLTGKGVFTPSLENPLISIPFAIFFRFCWKNSPASYRRYFLAAFLPNLALFILFGYKDEARNFSITFPAIILLAIQGAPYLPQIFAPSESGSS